MPIEGIALMAHYPFYTDLIEDLNHPQNKRSQRTHLAAIIAPTLVVFFLLSLAGFGYFCFYRGKKSQMATSQPLPADNLGQELEANYRLAPETDGRGMYAQHR